MTFFRYYQKSVHRTCLIFCMNLQQHNDLQMRQIFFCGNNFEFFLVPNEVFQAFSKVNAWNCPDFLHEVTAA